ncbi:hypothetical protein [Candidatus Ruminimicrobium bovinum]|uniref:hypothetical protein n=1 Tax=Candidatus Ruminimicrobium bovinum TaxID=3242779 RepID=UPI0039B9A40C
MNKKFLLFFIFIFFVSCGLKQIKTPENFVYIPIQTKNYTIASWQKITDKHKPIKIYVEGDGNAYTAKGYPTNDPTPKNSVLQKIAFEDDYENIMYLARPCQFIKDKNCNQTDWTTGRFSQKTVDNMFEAIKKISGNNEIILIGYSGGALLTGLIINQYKNNLNVTEWITIAGLLNHKDWTTYCDLIPLKDSLDLEEIPNIKQKHFLCKKDKVIPNELTLRRVDKKDCVFIDTTHDLKNAESFLNNF